MRGLFAVVILTALLGLVASAGYSFDEFITLKQDSFDTTSWISSVMSGPGALKYNITSIDHSSEISVIVLDKHNLDRYLSGMTYNHYTAYSVTMVQSAVLNRSAVNMTNELYLVIENMNVFSSVTVWATIDFVMEESSTSSFYAPVWIIVCIAVLAVALVVSLVVAVFVIVTRRRMTYTIIAADSTAQLLGEKDAAVPNF